MKNFLLPAILGILLIPAIVTGQQKGCNLQIGDTYAGGIVFFIVPTDSGCHGLVCAPSDQAKDMTWAQADTECKNLRIKGFSDWRLPNLYELSQMYTNLYQARLGGFAKGFYWSSNEYRGYYAWDINFDNGQKYSSGKGSTSYVRAVRAF